MRSAFSNTVTAVSGARQLLRRGQARRSRTDNRDALAGALWRRLGMNPALLEGVIDDGAFDDLDG